jgi:hypothetical protein
MLDFIIIVMVRIVILLAIEEVRDFDRVIDNYTVKEVQIVLHFLVFIKMMGKVIMGEPIIGKPIMGKPIMGKPITDKVTYSLIMVRSNINWLLLVKNIMVADILQSFMDQLKVVVH